VPEIAAWLGQLGLGQYAQRFADNEIDVFVLPHLTDHDLRDIGIPLGHRRKILAAIRGLETPSESIASLETPRGSEAERRQVTVMFADLVGSTALAGRMDPEDLRDIMSSYQKCVAATVRRSGGFEARAAGAPLYKSRPDGEVSPPVG
jgi:hypothetical protein